LQSYQQGLSPWPSATVSNGLQAWYRADLGVTTDANNNVSQWADVSGNGVHVVQSDVTQEPALTASAIGGLPAVQFARGNNLVSALADLQAGSTDVSVIVVTRPVANQGYTSLLDWNNFGVGNTTGDQYFMIWRDDLGGSHGYGTAMEVPGGNVQLMEFVKAGAQENEYLDGVLKVVGTDASPMGTAASPMKLGLNNSGWSYAGQIAEVLIYNRALSDAERAQIEAALTAKYILNDTNNNGIPDAWELKNLGTLQYGANDDPGGVGRTLLQSYQQGLSPWPSATVSNGLQAWYRADLGVTTDANNNVSQWADVSGNGVHVVQSDVTQEPALTASAIGGLPAVQFARGNNLVSALADLQAGSTDVSVIVVTRPVANQGYTSLLDWNNFGVGNTTGDQYFMIWRDDLGGSHGYGTAMEVPGGNVQLMEFVKAGAQENEYLDGVLKVVGTDASPMGTAASPMKLGLNNSGWSYAGQIAEVLIYNRALSDAERAQIEAALGHKFSIPVDPPTATLTSPVQGSLYSTSATITLSGQAVTNASGASITSVAFFNGTTSLGAGTLVSGTTSTYTLVLPANTFSAGSYNISMTAVDSNGASVSTAPVTIQVLAALPVPAVSSGLRAWYRADQGVTTDPLNSNNVSEWADISGNGLVEQGVGGGEPGWSATGMNGQPAVQFDNSRYTSLISAVEDLQAGSTDLSVIVVMAPAATQYTYATVLNYGNNFQLMRAYWNDPVNSYVLNWADIVSGYGSGGYYVPVSLSPDQAQIMEFVKNGSQQTSYLNGVSQVTGTQPGNMANGPAQLSMGDGLTAQIAEVLVYNRALSDAERAQVEASLGQNYSITVNPPTVTLTSPVQASLYAASAAITFSGQAVANVSGASIASVQFFNGATKLGDGTLLAGTTSTYNLVLAPNTLAPGLYNISMTATDSSGASGSTDPVTIQVAASLPSATVATGLRAWYRADQGVTTDPLNNNNVSEWADISGNGFVEQGVGGGEPGWSATGMNGQPTIQFDNSRYTSLISAVEDLQAGSTDLSVIVVMAPAATQYTYATVLNYGNNFSLMRSYWNGTGNGYILEWPDVVSGNGAEGINELVNLSPDRGQIMEFVKNGSQQTSYLNGVVQVTGAQPGNMASGPAQLSMGDGLTAQIAEVLVYNRALSEAERAQVEASLGQNYSITIAPSTPVFTPPAGTYGTAQSVNITCAGATSIYYTIDGSTPTTSSTAYSGPLSISTTTTLNAIGVNAGGSSPVTSGVYTIVPLPSAPVFTPTPGTYNTTQSVTITSAGATSIYYTTDGSTPTTSSTLYSGPISISTITTLSAIGVDAAGSSSVVSGTYTISSSTPIGLMAGGDTVLLQDASNVTRLWGRNNDGQLSDGTVISRSQMRRISGLTQPLISAALGEGHGLAVTHSGQVYTWGDNYFGQLGDGTQASHHTAVILTGLTGIIQVAAGDGHSLALRSDGTVWAWGGNQSGQLGDGTKVNRSSPVQIPGLANIVQVVAGARHSAALDKNGAVWVWGSNEFGQLGGGAAIADSSTPITLSGLSQVFELVSGRQFLLALKADGTVWAWGDNHAGQLGVGTTSTVSLPQLNPTLSGIKALAAGNNHAVALDGTGTVWMWGANDVGQLGNGTNAASATPVSGLTGVQAVSAGYDQVVVEKVDGTLWAWGLNTFGQLGNSTTNTFSNVPIAVAPPND